MPSQDTPAPGGTRRLVADLHVHSRFAMSTSRSLTVDSLGRTGARKGIDLLATGDFTHPTWRVELGENLEEIAAGLFQLRDRPAQATADPHRGGPLFILGTELSCIWRQDGRGRRVHFLVLAPSFRAVDAINQRLHALARLESDGRPALKLSAADLLMLLKEADPGCMVIPAHIWTPWYGIFGSKSGFDSLEACFGDLAGEIRAMETGLSSDPAMNWNVPELSDRSIVSFSDAHSPGTLGREATALRARPDFDGIALAVQNGGVEETIEFFPENGKYHLNGHRRCGVRLVPAETPADGRCPVCGRLLTLGVLHRVQQLSSGPIDPAPFSGGGLRHGPAGRPPFRRLVPLRDAIAEAMGVGAKTRRVERILNGLVDAFGSELAVLMEAAESDLRTAAGDEVAATVLAFRRGQVRIEAGYDGIYGTVHADID